MSNETVILPSLGAGEDALNGGRVVFWLVEIGQPVRVGGDLLEIETDKAAFVVPSPVGGILRKKLVQEDDDVKVGDSLAVIELGCG
jgi:pyruvate/2-oxoglutarate dehydrogenase complex dihydrolipoamide acyltransferase (E2) component